MNLSLPRGTSDLKPEESIKLKELLCTAENIFKLYGFFPLETPSIELVETLLAKAYGDENAKEIYFIDGKKEGLRYDLTVPLARYVASNKDIVLPFKRYNIGKVWRMDEPQKMREREFFQADIDIIGNTEITAEAELISATSEIIKTFGITNFEILINSRVILSNILSNFGIDESLHIQIMRIIDKLDKISFTEAKTQIVAKGISDNKTEELLELILSDKNNEDWISLFKTQIKNTKADADLISNLINLLKLYEVTNVRITPSLSRGMDYYTGLVWEFVVYENKKRLPTIASGGRYDNLIGLYLKKDIPAVGSSIGITRILELIKASPNKTYAEVFVSCIGKENLDYTISIVSELRKNRIKTDMSLLYKGISKQLDYANSLKIPFVIIIGEKEKKQKKATIKNMVTGIEQLEDINSIINILKNKII
ncbi:MAG: histidine--tRNA ligase [Candidatus Micrarchaeaceae archaeon]